MLYQMADGELQQAEVAGLTKNRIESLSDGVFAIAMTLLIFNIKVPTMASPNSSNELAAHLAGLGPSFVTYALSFISLGIYWVGHHNIYHSIHRTDRQLLWLNIIFLMFVAFLPFSTNVFSSYSGNRVAGVLFGVNLVSIGLFMYTQWRYAERTPGLMLASVSRPFSRMVKLRILTVPAVALVAIGASFIAPIMSAWIYLFLLPAYMIPVRLDRQTPDVISGASSGFKPFRGVRKESSASIFEAHLLP